MYAISFGLIYTKNWEQISNRILCLIIVLLSSIFEFKKKNTKIWGNGTHINLWMNTQKAVYHIHTFYELYLSCIYTMIPCLWMNAHTHTQILVDFFAMSVAYAWFHYQFLFRCCCCCCSFIHSFHFWWMSNWVTYAIISQVIWTRNCVIFHNERKRNEKKKSSTTTSKMIFFHDCCL